MAIFNSYVKLPEGNDGYDWLMNNILTVLWLVWLLKSLMKS